MRRWFFALRHPSNESSTVGYLVIFRVIPTGEGLSKAQNQTDIQDIHHSFRADDCKYQNCLFNFGERDIN